MASNFEPDFTLLGMPSLSAIKAFLASAKYLSFTRAASALCVTQAAVSKQVRELETFLGTELFVRSGRSLALTPDGDMFKDAAQLSFINILQASERLRKKTQRRHTLTICCSPAFNALWLQHHLPEFMEAHPQTEFTVLATHNFLAMEGGLQPDVYIAKMAMLHAGYDSTRLFDDTIYPVCSPRFLEQQGPLEEPQDLCRMPLLDISPYGRAQVSEHVDWQVWLAMQDVDARMLSAGHHLPYSSNDYVAVVQMALAHKGVALGWHHLVGHLVDEGLLVRPMPHAVSLKNRSHYLAVRKDKAELAPCQQFSAWIRQHFSAQ